MPPPIVMFVKAREKRTLVEKFSKLLKWRKTWHPSQVIRAMKRVSPICQRKVLRRTKEFPNHIQRRRTRSQRIWKACRESSSNSLMR